jgi:hypothetical protein
MHSSRSVPGLLVVAMATTASRSGIAGEAEVCVAAYETSQVLRKQGRLLEAADQLASCKRAECPELARKDCAQWFREVEEITPSVVFSVIDAQGRDVTAVRVLVDGVELLPRLDGRARPLNPGVHLFRFEPAERVPVEEQVLLYEGERNRVLNLALGPPLPPTPSSGSARPPPPPGAFALAGLGLVGGLGFAYFATSAVRDRDHLRDTCAPRCSEGDVSAVRTEVIVANVSLGIGVAAMAVAGWMFFGSRAQNSAVVLRAEPRVGGGFGALEGSF